MTYDSFLGNKKVHVVLSYCQANLVSANWTSSPANLDCMWEGAPPLSKSHLFYKIMRCTYSFWLLLSNKTKLHSLVWPSVVERRRVFFFSFILSKAQMPLHMVNMLIDCFQPNVCFHLYSSADVKTGSC